MQVPPVCAINQLTLTGYKINKNKLLLTIIYVKLV
jgi:hypothetical protein